MVTLDNALVMPHKFEGEPWDWESVYFGGTGYDYKGNISYLGGYRIDSPYLLDDILEVITMEYVDSPDCVDIGVMFPLVFIRRSE